MAPSGEIRGKGRCGVFAGKTVWFAPERLRGEVLTTRRYTNLRLPLLSVKSSYSAWQYFCFMNELCVQWWTPNGSDEWRHDKQCDDDNRSQVGSWRQWYCWRSDGPQRRHCTRQSAAVCRQSSAQRRRRRACKVLCQWVGFRFTRCHNNLCHSHVH